MALLPFRLNQFRLNKPSHILRIAGRDSLCIFNQQSRSVSVSSNRPHRKLGLPESLPD